MCHMAYAHVHYTCIIGKVRSLHESFMITINCFPAHRERAGDAKTRNSLALLAAKSQAIEHVNIHLHQPWRLDRCETFIHSTHVHAKRCSTSHTYVQR